jgi:hypothetical protein
MKEHTQAQRLRHLRAVARLHETIEGKSALLSTWEQFGEPDLDCVRRLKRELASAKTRLRNMRPVPEDEVEE